MTGPPDQDRPEVLFLHPSDEMYGADRQLLAAVRASVVVCRPTVVLPNDVAYEKRLSAQLRGEGIDVVIGPLPVIRRQYLRPAAVVPWMLRAIRGSIWLWRLLRHRRPAAVVTNTSAILAGPLAARLCSISHIWYVHEIVRSPARFRGLVRRLARLSSGTVIVISDAVADWLGPLGTRGPIVIRNAVAASDERMPLPERPAAVFVGRLSQWKGWQDFIAAAALVRDRLPEATFTLVGGVPPGGATSAADVQVSIDAPDPAGTWLTWAGEVEDARPFVRASWVVVVPSREPEPFGNVVLEGMAEGRAVIGTRHGGIVETVVDGKTGSLVPPADVQALAEAMSPVLSDRELATAMGSAGYERLLQCFDPQQWQEAWRSTIKTALED